MNCTQCGKEFEPTRCPDCAVALNPEKCTACGGLPAACPACGLAIQPPAPVAPPQQPYNAAPGTMPPPQQPYNTAPGTMPPPQQPYNTAPGTMPPPQQPYNTAPGTMPPPQQPYGMPPMGGYPYGGPVPTKKVALGGWLMVYLVLTCIGLGYQAYSLVISLTASSFSVLSLGITLVFSVLPAVMIIFFITQRDIKFKYWFYFSAIVTFVTSALGVLSIAALGSMLDSNPGFLSDILAAAGLGSISLPPSFMNVVIITAVVVLVLACLVQVAWWVYFNKSRRVAYTFNPHNNPPK